MNPKINIGILLSLASRVMQHGSLPDTQGLETVDVQGPISAMRFIKANIASIKPKTQELLGLLNQHELTSRSGLHIADFHFVDDEVHERDAWTADPRQVSVLITLGLATGLLEPAWPGGGRVPPHANDWRYRYVPPGAGSR